MSTESNTSSELEAILRRKALQLLSGGRRCCSVKYPVGYVLNSVEELGEAVKSCRAAFVMFFGRTCPYCRAFDPIFRHVGAKYADLANFVKAEVERFAFTASALGVMGTPTTFAFVDGEPAEALPGFAIAPVFEQFVQRNLRSARCG
ncbi:thioredoxin family protein [Thermoproteus uzoniensis]|uniref:thioredoxin family protein n=1 Tax=Thermoproteus uzoniensis TaxID=184117 RepID=UPI00069A82D8|nr:thioredoxin family protein [Thermoproteus uzoniensis]